MGRSQTDLFSEFDSEMIIKASRARKPAENGGYSEHDIEVLEGLEPVRRRPGMYIGGTDEKAMHHLFAEVIDNAMDEAVAGHATWIEVELAADRGLELFGAPQIREVGLAVAVQSATEAVTNRVSWSPPKFADLKCALMVAGAMECAVAVAHEGDLNVGGVLDEQTRYRGRMPSPTCRISRRAGCRG